MSLPAVVVMKNEVVHLLLLSSWLSSSSYHVTIFKVPQVVTLFSLVTCVKIVLDVIFPPP